jgi:hypothetical protein
MKSIILPLLFLCFTAFSQPFVSGEAGNRLGLNAGYNYHNVVLKVGGLVPYTRNALKSNVGYVSAGYQIGFITPYVGIAGYQVTNIHGHEIKKTVLLCSLELGKDLQTAWGGDYRLYLSGTYANDIFYGMGLKIYIK